MARIGIMGGTFDPIHNGHLMLGRQAYSEYGLDQVWYMPSGQPPHKKGQEVSPAADRCAMVSLAVKQEKGLYLSEFETLKLLGEERPSDEFYFIIGADSLYEIENWYHPEEILARAEILAAAREYKPGVTGAQLAWKYEESVTGAPLAWKYGRLHRSFDDQIAYLKERFGARIRRLHCAEMDISSHEIRQAVSQGLSIRKWVLDAVADYIEEHHLYQEKRHE